MPALSRNCIPPTAGEEPGRPPSHMSQAFEEKARAQRAGASFGPCLQGRGFVLRRAPWGRAGGEVDRWGRARARRLVFDRRLAIAACARVRRQSTSAAFKDNPTPIPAASARVPVQHQPQRRQATDRCSSRRRASFRFRPAPPRSSTRSDAEAELAAVDKNADYPDGGEELRRQRLDAYEPNVEAIAALNARSRHRRERHPAASSVRSTALHDPRALERPQRREVAR